MFFDTYATLSVCHELVDERERQHKRFGEQNHPDGTDPGHYIHMANTARSICEIQSRAGGLTYADILREEVYEALAETDKQMLRAELVQVAAVAVAWIEKLDRGM